jgi:hypothetical protein
MLRPLGETIHPSHALQRSAIERQAGHDQRSPLMPDLSSYLRDDGYSVPFIPVYRVI